MDLCLLSAGEALETADSAASRLIPGSCTRFGSSSSGLRNFPGLGFSVEPLNPFHSRNQQGVQRENLSFGIYWLPLEIQGRVFPSAGGFLCRVSQVFCGVCKSSSSSLGIHAGVWAGIREVILLMDKKLIFKYSGGSSTVSAPSQGMRHRDPEGSRARRIRDPLGAAPDSLIKVCKRLL